MPLVVRGILLLWLVAVPWACSSRVRRDLVLAAAFLLGLLFLPMVDAPGEDGDAGAFTAIALPGLALDKYNVISLAVLLAVVLVDGRRLAQFRLCWTDLPMLAWCLCPLPSVVGAPPPDGRDPFPTGLAQCFGVFLVWGVPYFVGKLYFNTFERLRDLACLFVLGAILYCPLCLYEIRMSPQLHLRVYGFFQHDFQQSIRYGGFRPMVFMQHGLAVGLFLVTATLAGFLLWASGAAKEVLGGRPRWLARWLLPCLLGMLAVTTFLGKSTGALALGAAGVVVLALARWPRTALPLCCLLLVCPLYIGGRTSGAWSGSSLVPAIQNAFGQDRADSFAFRQENEDLLMERAFEGPPFGWAGWGRNLVHDRYGKLLTVPDGLWVIVLGGQGLPGLVALWLAMLLPVARFLWLQPVSTWTQPRCAGATACAVVVVLYMLDNLMNNMHNHVFVVMAGGLAALARTPTPAPPLPPAVTDRGVFLWSLFVTRRARSGMQRPGAGAGAPAGPDTA
jgi:hypothetical protein